jgi:carbon storage regulator
MLVLSRKRGQIVCIGEDITVMCLGVCGQIVKIGIEAPPSVRILRGELCRGDKSLEGGLWCDRPPPPVAS